MSFFLFLILGGLIGILWNVLAHRFSGIGVMADIGIGMVGAVGGGALTAYPDLLSRLWVLNPLGIALGVGGAGGALFTAALIAAVPASESGNF
jgi:uncharacterized membrane protein YeaQ/YmgE (transglycosylase-associated protein family)